MWTVCFLCSQLQLSWKIQHGERNDGRAGEGEAGAEHGRQLQLPVVVLGEDGAQQRRPQCLHGRNTNSPNTFALALAQCTTYSEDS